MTPRLWVQISLVIWNLFLPFFLFCNKSLQCTILKCKNVRILELYTIKIYKNIIDITMYSFYFQISKEWKLTPQEQEYLDASFVSLVLIRRYQEKFESLHHGMSHLCLPALQLPGLAQFSSARYKVEFLSSSVLASLHLVLSQGSVFIGLGLEKGLWTILQFLLEKSDKLRTRTVLSGLRMLNTHLGWAWNLYPVRLRFAYWSWCEIISALISSKHTPPPALAQFQELWLSGIPS